MDINSAFPSNFLRASDLKGSAVSVTLDRVEMEKVGDDHKPVIYFTGKEKGLVLNKTNANIIEDIVGSADTDQWRGKAVTLFPTKTEFQGKRVDCLRFREPEGAAAPAEAAPVAADDLPF